MPVKQGTLVSFSWRGPNDSLSWRTNSVYGYITGIERNEITIAPIRLTLHDSSRNVVKEARDSGSIQPLSVPVSTISFLEVYTMPDKRLRMLDIIPYGLGGVFALSPLLVVNHANATLNTGIYGWLLLGGYLAPVLTSVAIESARSRHKAYHIRPAKPAYPSGSDYYLEIRPE